jgi:hypothetical protein
MGFSRSRVSAPDCNLAPDGVPQPARFDRPGSQRACEGPFNETRRFAIAAPGATKRLKELARQQKQREKAEKREQRKREKAERPAPEQGVDPDIAGIVPGPQPPLEW